MITTKLLIMIIIISLNSVFAQENIESNSSLSIVNDKYFGQNPPGMVAEIFAPGIDSVNGRYDYGVSFTPDLEEIYFTAYDSRDVKIWCASRSENG